MGFNYIFDSHAHYDDTKFDGIREDLLPELNQNGVKYIINNAIDCADSAYACLDMCKQYDFCYMAIGIHPENADHNVFDAEIIKKFCAEEKVVAIGEIGLDYYWTKDNRETQLSLFENQLILANEIDMPVVVHDRDAHSDTIQLLKKHTPRGVVHCFSGSREMANQILQLGMFIGIGGVVTFKNARKLCEIAQIIPLDRLLLETDAPYLSPEPHRGKLCRSDYIIHAAAKIAELRNTTTETILKAAYDNASKLFFNK
ncbi:MAG: TatD family hydrolase [bacterium]|nr:TatD family hydrolase [bacterium]